ncbi:GNAT family N-acetyltransferase [Rathayibacter toxicus]|uniref:GNAT family N-acetyltransferase n=1 Tax=Rathayibacter toxicus TaxID=145458 RepID=A0A2S5Y5F3_9MICO|nr:GNAT family N-acetyltransferase [Rathayibacter toxicus]ALS57559.1 hypothetical protein APU90_07065 [Rathayibacter toxicus]PPG20773.1 GNAT family N-acetyltransferase [Rathayibacter toxicus]PPG45876.1 GNAT family N-acetyltransferase [Rathayibacter toxicus]PPH21817.1 GNAT family N-acetyltransferase [Rathayibacter toxicus]PPH56247.1 GNAT family N-acetyltransferase [Rathayibacter toxicus]
MSLQIRPTEAKDLPAIVEVYNHAVRETLTTLDTEQRSIEQMTEWLAAHRRGRYCAFTGTIDGEVVGYTSLSPFAPRGGYLASAEASTYVSPNAQGRQVGGQLTRFVTEEAVRRGFTTVLGMLTANNDASRRMIERIGYSPAGEWKAIGVKNGVLIDMLLYQYRIAANEAGYERL